MELGRRRCFTVLPALVCPRLPPERQTTSLAMQSTLWDRDDLKQRMAKRENRYSRGCADSEVIKSGQR